MTPEEKGGLLKTLAGHLRSSAAILDELAAEYETATPDPVVTPPTTPPTQPDPVVTPPTTPDPVTPPVTPPAGPGVDTSRPIWEQGLVKPSYAAPATVEAPAGQNVVIIPVTLAHTNLGTAFVHVNRAINQSPATINVGSRNAAFIGRDIYRWSLGDDLTHYIKLQFPDASYRDGQSVRLQLKGIGTANEWVDVNVVFRDGAEFPAQFPQRHRAPRRLNVARARQQGDWNRDPATWEWSDTGYKGSKRVLRSRLSHGHAQVGNKETGAYLNDEVFPDRAQNPHSYDPAERAVRLATAVMNDGQPAIVDRVNYPHQASVLQAQTIDALCGSEGVWRIVAKLPTKRFTWPAFWLVGRGSRGYLGGSDPSRPGWTAWPPEIDIFEIFNQIYNQDPINGYRVHWGQHFGPNGSRARTMGGNFGGHFDVDRLVGANVRYDEGYHAFAAEVSYNGNDAEVTFFFDDMELGAYKLFARNPDMITRDVLFPIMNVAVRAPESYTSEQWKADTKLGDMLVRDLAYFPKGSGYTVS